VISIKEDKEIVKSWITGNCSATLVIPKEFAKEYGLDKPAHVIVEKTPNGILIRKLEMDF
jgi:antitoxin component of MazEF toxin-antitoxin module